MSYTKTEVMIDIETLSTKQNAAIVQIGAVKFCLSKGIISTFKVNVCPKSCKEHGLHIDKKTIEWWGEQSKEARQSWSKDPQQLGVALQYFLSWYGEKSHPTWSKGSYFDFPILENALNSCDYQVPWKYWDVYDYRTLINVCGIDDRKLKSEGSVYHDAVSDCEEQVKVLLPILTAIRNEN
jgi:hypothetical protein